jgi:uncharacterized protein YecE (DUF72 family)
MVNDFNIGTSGWRYDGWIGPFYPEKIKPYQLLPYYAETFDSVELNNSFYRIPNERNVKAWMEMTPAHFVFSCKANRTLTHYKKLKDCEETIVQLLRAFSHFEDKLGPILFQFPPHWPIDLSTLQKFIVQLPQDKLFTFEFRHQSWFCNALYDLLSSKHMGLCLYNHQHFTSPEIITSSFVYLRMHGPNKDAYTGSYDDSVLLRYKQKCMDWKKEGKAIYCYFDNTDNANAPKDAQRFKNMLCYA